MSLPYRKQRKNRPLGARVINGVLTIEIGVDTLAFAALHEPGKEERAKHYVITSNAGFANDVVCSLLHEAEDGSSMLTELFDKAIEHAIDDGAEYFEHKEGTEQ